MKSVEDAIRMDLEYFRQSGTSFVGRMKENKDFQNPKILQQTIDYFQIDGNGTQFDPVDVIMGCTFSRFVPIWKPFMLRMAASAASTD